MSVRQQIPAVDGVADKKTAEIIAALKEVVEIATGRSPKKMPITKLGGSATLAGVINKVNEIIDRLQG